MGRSTVFGRAVAAGVILFATAVPAAAEPTSAVPPGCPAGTLCVWTLPGYRGHLTVYQDGVWDGRCQRMRTPVGSVADLTGGAPWRLDLFVFHSARRTDTCTARGVYAHYAPGQSDPAVPGGPATGIRIYADPNPGPVTAPHR